MKKIKSVLLTCMSCAILLASCGGLPTQTTPIKANGIKISNIYYRLAIDKEDSLYFVDKNVIKKVTSNGDLSIVGGKETPAPYVENATIDGDIKTAKFGIIGNVTYVEKDNSVYFTDSFPVGKNTDKTTYYSYIRKITNNIVKTVFKFEPIPDYFLDISISNNGELYINKGNFITKKDLFSEKTVDITANLDDKKNPLGAVSLADNDGTIYELVDNGTLPISYILYVLVNDKWKKVFSTNSSNIALSIDKYNNLYILENTAIYNIDHEKTSSFYSPRLLHKIPKEKIIEAKGEIYLGYKEYVIGELVQNSGYGFISSNDGTKIYGLDENSIYKINIGDNK